MTHRYDALLELDLWLAALAANPGMAGEREAYILKALRARLARNARQDPADEAGRKEEMVDLLETLWMLSGLPQPNAIRRGGDLATLAALRPHSPLELLAIGLLLRLDWSAVTARSSTFQARPREMAAAIRSLPAALRAVPQFCVRSLQSVS